MLELDQETVGVITAVWHWCHITSRSDHGLKILYRVPNAFRVRVLTSGPGFTPTTATILLVHYSAGRLEEQDGKAWNFIVGENGLEFRAA